MKKIYFLLFAFCFLNGLSAQIINIPDANFKAKLLEANETNGIAWDINGNLIKIDLDNDGEIQIDEALKVYMLNLFDSHLSKLIGIEKFKNLTYLQCGGNQLTLLDVSTITNLEELSCGSNQLTSLNVNGLKKLTRLQCGSNQLPNLDLSSLISLAIFDCSGNVLQNLILASNIHEINCSNNKLTALNLSGLNNLAKLNCSNNQLPTLNLLGLSSLTYLDCFNNQLSNLDLSGLSNLNDLNCSNNKLTQLNVPGLGQLVSLDCSKNIISYLNLIELTQLRHLFCNENNLSDLNISGLNNLTMLECYSNKLTNLNIKENLHLWDLSCDHNLLTSLDLKGLSELSYLAFSDNYFTSIDLTGLSELEIISFYSNNIATIDFSSSPKLTDINGGKNPIETIDFSQLPNLENLWLGFTPITTLDLSNSNKLKGINVSDCPNLEFINLKNGSTENLNYMEPELLDYFKTDCSNFSNCPKLKYICGDEGELESINQKTAGYNYTGCIIGGYCSFDEGGTNYTIQGNNRIDSNNNGYDASDLPASNVKFSISDGIKTATLITNDSGNYSIKVKEGTYSIIPIIENPDYFTISPSSLNVTFPTDATPFIQNFSIKPTASHKDLEIVLIPLEVARPGFDTKYKMMYKNKGNVAQSGVINLTFNDSVLDVVISNPVVSSQNINNLSWSFSNLKPFETREITFILNVNGPTETPAVNNGDILHYTASINSVDIDETPNDNTFDFNHTVVGSYDPNDKTCLEGNIITPSLIGEYVHYLIRFENKGTYPAQNIVVKDMIDLSKFDISTLIPTSSSHSFVTKISEGNKVEFIFENINLPFDDANNDGYIAFKIKTKPTLKVGDSFDNEANIYFDYNFPVLTNKATSTFKTTLGTEDLIFSDYLTIHPNPVKEVLNISSKSNIQIQSIAVYDILGQLVIALPNIKDTTKIDVSNLKTGSYFLKVKSDKGISNLKFIKD